MNKKIYTFDKYFEKELTLPDLKTPGRGDILVKKLKNKEKVKLKNGEEVDIEKMRDTDIDGDWVDTSIGVKSLVDDSGSFDIEKATDYLKNTKKSKAARANSYVKVFKDEDTNKEYTLSDFQKSSDFGSTGAGVRIKEHESIQMMFLAKRLSDNKPLPGALTDKVNGKNKYSYPEMSEILKKFVGKNVDFGRVKLKTAPGFKFTEAMCNHYVNDESWLSTFCNVPNLLVSQTDSNGRLLLSSQRSYTIFHVSNKDKGSTPNVIFNKYKSLSKGDNFKSFPEFSGSFNVEFSKYCPADIYIVDSNLVNVLNEGINSCNDILELSTYLNDSFTDRQIIPVSLKRVGPSPRSATIIVNAEEDHDIPTFDVKSFRLSKDMNKGIGSKIMTNSEWKHNGEKIERERNLTIDSPNTRISSNVDGEIDGKWARHGKVSLLWMKKFIEGSDLFYKVYSEVDGDNPIMEYRQLKDFTVDQLKKMLEDIESDIFTLAPKIDIDIQYSTAGREIKGNVENKLISKIQSLQIIRALAIIDKYDDTNTEVDNIVSKMLLYALSIQNPGFSSPKYIRVI